jgi:hypothetical protein
MPRTLNPPRPYEILVPLGAAGMGEVYGPAIRGRPTAVPAGALMRIVVDRWGCRTLALQDRQALPDRLERR